MIYEEFKENFKGGIKEALADKGFDVTIRENRTEKLNESFDSISVTPEIRPSEIRGMSEVLGEMMGNDMVPIIDPADEQMFVATVSDKVHGAGVIACPDFMENAAVKLEGDWIMPVPGLECRN